MREIKFRAWDGEKFVYSELRQDGGMNHEGETERDILSVSQFTGLHDRNGKEIYEGDIVTLKNKPSEIDADHMQGTGPVIWRSDDLAFAWQNDDCQPPLTWGGTETIEVVGNVFETPELLTKN